MRKAAEMSAAGQIVQVASSATLAAALAFALPAGARPDAPPKTEPQTEPAAPPSQPLAPGERRPLPDYDGRPEEPDDSDGLGTWTLRVVLFPAYVVSEYVIRRPLGWLTVAAERAHLVTTLVDFFTFGPDRNAGLIPTALIDFGFTPSVGLYFFWDDALARGNKLRVHAATWGPRWLRLSVKDSYEIAPETRMGVLLDAWQRPDWLFYGLGPQSRQDDGARFTRSELDGTLRLELALARSSSFTSYAGVHNSRFEDAGCCDDLRLGQVVTRGAYATPPGFDSGYALVRHGFELAIDSRRPRPDEGSGLRWVAHAQQALRLRGDAPDQWVHYGAALAGFIDLTRQNRVLGLSVMARFADPIGTSSHAIPFTEQVRLGGNAPLRGFLEGRLVDRSAVAARLEYTWPIWVLLDGSLNAEAGNVFGEHLADFDAKHMRLSFGVGVHPHGERDHPFEALLGFGTAPLSEGARIESVRFVFGAVNGF